MSFQIAARRVSVLALSAFLFTPALVTPAPSVSAQSTEPVARLQIVLKQVEIHDDRDGIFRGDGEMKLWLNVYQCAADAEPPCEGSGTVLPFLATAEIQFGAGTGEIVSLDQTYDLAVSPGPRYVVSFIMNEQDGSTSAEDQMGMVYLDFTSAELSPTIGTHVTRSLKKFGTILGDYTMTYEIRRAPLPDLQPVGITVQDLPASASKHVCVEILNLELVDAEPFEVALRVNGTPLPNAKKTADRLPARGSSEVCIDAELPTSQFELAAVIDEARALPEFNEANNVHKETFAATGPAPTPSPSPTQADLTVSAIKINGRVPDGKDDCKDGKNDVAVVVKNAGMANASPFSVRLVVDDAQNDVEEQTVAGLDAGKEREVKLEDVRLKKGERKLTAVVDAKNTVSESKEDNNELKVTARCKDDD
jgi:hypothetical protein